MKKITESFLKRACVIVLLTFLLINAFPQVPCYKLIWSDEFDYTGIPDTTKWGYDVGDGCDYGICGWGNLEAQYYTYRDLDNAHVENGSLFIEAKNETIANKKYSSARLVTRDQLEITYGKLEFRAKVPAGKGTWSALWLLGDRETLDWPYCGEIDIMEYTGMKPDVVSGTVHQASAYGGDGPTASISITDAKTAFHTYAIEWNPDSIVWYVDDVRYHVYKNEYTGDNQWPYDKKFYMIMNLAVGGTLGGPIDNTIFNSQVAMIVDYVRVYQQPAISNLFGKEVITKSEANLTFTSLIPANKFTWTVPSGVDIVSGEGTSSIVLDWGCVEGTIELEIETDCDTSTVSLPVSFKETEMEGDMVVYTKEQSVSYSIPPVTGAIYSWSLPADVTAIGPVDSNVIELNWGCSAGQVSVNVTGICLTSTVTDTVNIVPLKIKGLAYLPVGSKYKIFHVDEMLEGTFTWEVPNGVSITSGASSGSIEVDWGTIPGFVKVQLINDCGTLRDSIFVNITNDQVIVDFDVIDPAFNLFGECTLDKMENPSKTGLNISDFVGATYKLAGAVSWAGMYTDLEEKMDFSSGTVFSMLIYAPRTGNVLIKLEDNSAMESPVSVITAITKTNEWEKLFFDFIDAPTDAFDRITLFFDFEQVNADTFYFDYVALNRNGEPGLYISNSETIIEGSENGKVITLDLVGDMFVPSLTNSNWAFGNLPEGVSVGTVSRISDTKVELILSGNCTADYDEDITDFTVTVQQAEFMISEAPMSINSGVVFTALIEDDLRQNQLFGNGIRIYPNPARDVIFIEINDDFSEKLTIKVINLSGKIIQSISIKNGGLHSLDISQIAPGLYLLILEDNQGVYRKRFIHN